jgi:hypothetical protein
LASFGFQIRLLKGRPLESDVISVGVIASNGVRMHGPWTVSELITQGFEQKAAVFLILRWECPSSRAYAGRLRDVRANRWSREPIEIVSSMASRKLHLKRTQKAYSLK